MKKINNITKWEVVIDWVENEKYLKLTSNERERLKKFRRINQYIKTLKSSIDQSENKIKELKEEIRNRVEKIRLHKLSGLPLYEELVELKKENEVVVYYSEGIHRKQLKGNWTKVRGDIKEYPQTNLKYKSRYTRNPKSVNLKPTRRETLGILKEIIPEWYKQFGERLLISNYSNKKDGDFIKQTMIRLFQPYIKEILENNSKNRKTKTDFRIKFDDIIKLMKKKNNYK